MLLNENQNKQSEFKKDIHKESLKMIFLENIQELIIEAAKKCPKCKQKKGLKNINNNKEK